MRLPVPVQSPEISQRAEELVIDSIARFPQSWSGSIFLADHVMSEFKPELSLTSQIGIGLRQLALMEIDGERAAARINRIHDAFEIPRRVYPEQAAHYVSVGARSALEDVRLAVRRVAIEEQLVFPRRLRGYDANYDFYAGDVRFVLGKIKVIHEWLRQDEGLRTRVISDIGESAMHLQKFSRHQQASARAKVHDA